MAVVMTLVFDKVAVAVQSLAVVVTEAVTTVPECDSGFFFFFFFRWRQWSEKATAA